MRKYWVMFSAFVIAAMLASPVFSKTNAGSNSAIIIIGGHEHWMPGTGPFKGAMLSAMSGDPNKPGPYIVRLKLPPNATFGAHYHGDVENLTIISGTLYVGLGDKVDRNKLTALHAGDFAHVNTGVHHYALTKSDGAVIQISGSGPMTMTMVGGKM
jgi:quercetin dioxygenase-like cupin family protein